MSNINCLESIACPKCTNDAEIVIAVTTLARVTDDGAETHGDMEWDGDSFAECPQCEYRGTLAEFRTQEVRGDSTELVEEARL